MVIQQQPTSVPINTAVQTPSGDNYLTLSAVMTCLVIIIGGWPSLLCTISALLMSYNVSTLFLCFITLKNNFSILPHQAKDEERRGNIASARTKANISLGLNIAAVVFVIVMWSVVAIPVAVTVSAQAATPYSAQAATPYCYPASPYYYCSATYCYYSSYYYYCYYDSFHSKSSFSYTSYSYYYYYSQQCSSSYDSSCYYG